MPAEGTVFLRISTEQVTEAVTLLDLYSEEAHFVSRSGHLKFWLMFFLSFLSIPEKFGYGTPISLRSLPPRFSRIHH